MKKRIISAIIMLIICVPIIWYGKSVFRLGVGIVGVLALKELLDLKKSHNEIPFSVQFIAMACLSIIILTEYDSYTILYGITYKGIAFLLLSLLLPSLKKESKYTATDALILIGSVLLIGTSFNTMILVRMLSLYRFIYLILIFVLTDTFAFLGGKLFGKHKLIEHVSPNKTIEGSIIGTLIGTLGTSIFYHFLVGKINLVIILMTLILSIIGQMGDLIFSKIKRENKIKDFSNLIPGHGGILDRLDSTIAIMLGYLVLYRFF